MECYKNKGNKSAFPYNMYPTGPMFMPNMYMGPNMYMRPNMCPYMFMRPNMNMNPNMPMRPMCPYAMNAIMQRPLYPYPIGPNPIINPVYMDPEDLDDNK